MDSCSGRRLIVIGEMAVNSRSQLVSLNQTANAKPTTTRVGPPGMRVPGTPWEPKPSLDFRRRPAPQEPSFMIDELVSSLGGDYLAYSPPWSQSQFCKFCSAQLSVRITVTTAMNMHMRPYE